MDMDLKEKNQKERYEKQINDTARNLERSQQIKQSILDSKNAVRMKNILNMEEVKR